MSSALCVGIWGVRTLGPRASRPPAIQFVRVRSRLNADKNSSLQRSGGRDACGPSMGVISSALVRV